MRYEPLEDGIYAVPGSEQYIEIVNDEDGCAFGILEENPDEDGEYVGLEIVILPEGWKLCRRVEE